MMAALSGNGGAYNRLLTEVGAWLQRYYARRLPASHVDDVVQEALVAIHLKRHTYEPERPFRAWMTGIARYKWIDRLRSNNRDRSDPIEGLEVPIEDHASEVSGRMDVQKLLTQLKPAQADVIRLVKVEGYTIQEASAATGQSIALVKVNIHRGIARLASAIDGDQDIA
ncbi:sigma-70 family RNA polymerase sigma factor [Sphingomonas populi]|uniref:Sigma-70 family RNA polymerase sigma factor n=2 Tax=Sphingomonas populi TaxID=2484750 RepID=A0A4Q6XXS9_9SPHN|nr:sigma-70 family RNA polymerase sigma factor [Sphingomonas populi]